MEKPVTLSSARYRKLQTEAQISQILKRLEQELSVSVADITLTKVQDGSGKSKVFQVKLEIKL